MEPKNWSKEKPKATEDGYYAFRSRLNPEDLTFCYLLKGIPMIAVSKQDLRDRPEQLLDISEGEWFGPIELPR